jgi:acyl-CoA synthetase (NDP forming)
MHMAWCADAWQAHAEPRPAAAPRLAPRGAVQAARALLAKAGPTLTESEAKRVLAAYGVPVVKERLTANGEEALSAGRALGYPVVLKAESPTLLHKTELGVVKLAIGDDAALRKAYGEIIAAAKGHELRGVLVQPML